MITSNDRLIEKDLSSDLQGHNLYLQNSTSEIVSSKVKIHNTEAFTRNELIAKIKTECEKIRQKKNKFSSQ